MADATLTQDYLLQLFDYKEGKLIYKNKTHKFSKIKIGNEAGCLYSNGYLNVKLFSKPHAVHRLIFLMHYGYLPKSIDHIDGNKTNNKIENLRECNCVTNGYNRKLSKNSSSGIKNVSWDKNFKKWRVSLVVNKSFKHIGHFEDLELAELVAQEARNKYHKHFAREK